MKSPFILLKELLTAANEGIRAAQNPAFSAEDAKANDESWAMWEQVGVEAEEYIKNTGDLLSWADKYVTRIDNVDGQFIAFHHKGHAGEPSDTVLGAIKNLWEIL